MKKVELRKIAEEVVEVMEKSVPSFFVNKNEKVEIPAKYILYEQKAQIINDVEMYFFDKLNNDY